MNALLAKLHLQERNLGVCTGPDGWLDSGAEPLLSYNPTTGEPIGWPATITEQLEVPPLCSGP